MAISKLKGKFVPDKNGKLKPVLKWTETYVDFTAPASFASSSLFTKPPALFGGLWRWIRNRIF